jgi:hypothetical protein
MQKTNFPVLISALTCEQVITDTSGKHTLVGLFTNINAPEFPAVHPRMTLFCAWINTGKKDKYRIKVGVEDPDGEILGKEFNGEIEFKEDKIITYGILNFEGIMFEKEGKHFFGIYLNEEEVVRVPVIVGPPKSA